MTGFDLFAEARAAVDRARAAQQAVNKLVAPTTDGGNRQTADEGVPTGSDRVELVVRAGTPNSPSAEGPAGVAVAPAGPQYAMTQDEYDEIRAEIWCEPWKAPDLFPDCLSHVVRRLGDLAMRPVEDLEPLAYPYPVQDDDVVSEWATDLLRELFSRAKSGVPFGEPETVWGDLGPTNPKDV